MDELSGGSTQPIQLLSKDFIYQGESSLLVHDQGPPRVERIEYESSSNCLILNFNETINPSSITNSVEIEYGGNIITGSIEITGDNQIKFTPSGNLSPNVDYIIKVKDIKDAAGKTIEVFSYNFELNQEVSLVFNYSVLAKNTHSLYGNNSLMHGRDYEPEIGLYYFRNRYYHPQLGRFLQQDPNGYEDSLNTYQAFNQNPVNFNDPFGTVDEIGNGFITEDYVEESYRNRFINAERGQRFLDYSQSIALGAGFALIAPYFEVPVIIAAVGSYMIYRGLDSYSSRRMAGQSGTQALRGGIVDAVPFGGFYYGISGRDPGTLQKIPSELRTRIMDQEMGLLTGSVIGLSFYRPSPSNFELIDAWGLTRGKVLHETVNPNGTIVRVVDPVRNSIQTTIDECQNQINSGSANLWNKSEFEGTIVYQRDDLIDLTLMDSRGRTNLQRMEKGLAPLGPDGEPINLHHLTQTKNGAIAEVEATFHQKYYKTIHINTGNLPSAIDRNIFQQWRKLYWSFRALWLK
jgi:RHS repeat-associated protein